MGTALSSTENMEAGLTDTPLHRARIQASIDGVYLGQLVPISEVIAGYYFLLTVAHYFLLSAPIRDWMMATAFSASLVGALTALLARTGRIAPRWSHAALLPAALLATFNVYLHIALTHDPFQLTNNLLMLLAFGIITLSPRVYAFLAVTGMAVSGLNLHDAGGAHMAHLTFMLVGGLILSVLSFTQRYRTLWNVEHLLIANMEKTAALEVAGEEVARQMREARQAAEEARKANEAKDIFLANTSHELRTPLTGVLGMLELLNRSRLDAEQRETLDAAQFSARTLLAVINDVLDLAKLDAGRIEIHPQPFRPLDLVQTVAGLLEPRAEEKGIDLVLTVPDQVPVYLMGDPIRIGQILFNFLSNAVKFTDEGEVEVCMELAPGAKDCQLTLRVRDTGIGFDMAEADHLFERFQQLDSGADRRHEGTGLGLAICKELADLMAGSITVESAPGKGSVFTLVLSLPKAEGTAEERATQASAGAQKLIERKLSLLVAEDNPVNQLLIRKLLEPYGWQVTIVGNGAEALAEVKAGKVPDLILMDVRMPVMDGVAATRAIRALAAPAGQVPVIALTANTMPGDAEAYMAAGMNAVVGKPVQVADLMAAIAGVVDAPAAGG